MTDERINRKLAAILAADVVGYSRLMEADEAGTLAALKRHREFIFDPAVAAHNGRIVKLIGDGAVVEFGSVVDAVNCALSVQRSGASMDQSAPQPTIVLRIGINLGDVIIESDDIYGDGVNIAVRLEGLAAPGGICVSGTVRDHIGGRLPYAFEDMGEQSVKNIARPIRVYALRPERTADVPTASVSSTASSSPLGAAPRLSIVVLPFTNLSDDREQQYFADGITEDLTTDLSRLANMFVISRNTAFTYRNKPIDTKQIGRELGVRYVLEGSVRRSGNQVRVNTQLISRDRRASVDGAVRPPYGGSVRSTRRNYEPDRERARHRADRRRGCPTDRQSRRAGLHPPRTRRVFEAAVARQLCRCDKAVRARAGARSAIRRGTELLSRRARWPRAGWNDRLGGGRHRTRGRADRPSLGVVAPQPGCALRQG
jgi:class 3 adenylate cyclase/TolB-like protein